jgi:hypothetical protein
MVLSILTLYAPDLFRNFVEAFFKPLYTFCPIGDRALLGEDFKILHLFA